jgi:hypothetical protein
MKNGQLVIERVHWKLFVLTNITQQSAEHVMTRYMTARPERLQTKEFRFHSDAGRNESWFSSKESVPWTFSDLLTTPIDYETIRFWEMPKYWNIDKRGLESRNLETLFNQSDESKFYSDKYHFHDANIDSPIHCSFALCSKMIDESEWHWEKYELHRISRHDGIHSCSVPSHWFFAPWQHSLTWQLMNTLR